MMRAQAITGRTDYVNQWLGGRQFGRWVYQQPPKPEPAPDPDEQLQRLIELRDQGVIDDAEFESLRGRIEA
jgi:putative oligomerization/nucleic acid binding protein